MMLFDFKRQQTKKTVIIYKIEVDNEAENEKKLGTKGIRELTAKMYKKGIW